MDETLLSHLLDHFKSRAVVAGGYVRDRILGVEPRDCDVFISCSVPEWVVVCNELKDKGYHWEEVCPDKDEYKLGHIRTTGTFTKNVMGTPVVYDIPINVILTAATLFTSTVRWARYINNYFDFNICKALITHTGDIIKLKGFETDVENKTITYNTSCLTQLDSEQQRKHSMYKSLMIRREKLLAKFPDYEVRIE